MISLLTIVLLLPNPSMSIKRMVLNNFRSSAPTRLLSTKIPDINPYPWGYTVNKKTTYIIHDSEQAGPALHKALVRKSYYKRLANEAPNQNQALILRALADIAERDALHEATKREE